MLGHSDGLLSGMCGCGGGGGEETLTLSPSAIYLALSSVGGTIGDAVRMLNQNRHQ